MSKIIVSFKGATIAEYELRAGEMSIGRKSTADIQIDSLAVSGRHARIVTQGDTSTLEDLGSTNGTFINDNKISNHQFQNGDAAQIGKHTITFVAGSSPLVEEDDDDDDEFEKTVVLGVNAMPAMAAVPKPVAPAPSAAPAPAPSAAAPTIGGLQILNGPRTGLVFKLAKSLTNVGQKGHCAAVISRRSGGYHLAHVDGPNPPSVNGEKLGKQAKTLSDGDIVEIGTIKMQFQATAAS
ncbi:MAG: FHA domain-containing protein [Immundisolibacteraceae bacterium]|nr:FHA domain-containing protein [Immundisolibacteraceae bacterium]